MDEDPPEVEEIKRALIAAKKEIEAKNKLIAELRQQIIEIERKHDKGWDI